MLSSGMKCYHLGCNVIIWSQFYHLGRNVIIWDEMLSSGVNVIILDKMSSFGMKCYHLGCNVIIWDAMLSSGATVIIWDKMLSCGANIVMLSFGANVIIWCYHVMLSSGMITHPFFIFPKNFTHSNEVYSSTDVWQRKDQRCFICWVFAVMRVISACNANRIWTPTLPPCLS